MTVPAPTRDVVLITGASNGIGADLARIFARNGFDLALVARDAARLAALADEIAQPGRPRPIVLPFDLTVVGAIDTLKADLSGAGARCAILVNNAGFGLAGSIADLGRADQIGIVDLNVRAASDLIMAFLPDVIAARGRILNVASTASYFPGPGMAVYYASKAYLLSLSRALGFELRKFGVTVTALCPGPTATGFAARAGMSGYLFTKMRPMDSMPVAQAGYDGLMAGRSVVVTGLVNKLLTFVSHFIPPSVSMPVIAWLQQARRRES
jgi:short-subunit dehydrogenase